MSLEENNFCNGNISHVSCQAAAHFHSFSNDSIVNSIQICGGLWKPFGYHCEKDKKLSYIYIIQYVNNSIFNNVETFFI